MNKSVVLITGASAGVGSAAAVAFAKKDARWSLPVGVKASPSRWRSKSLSPEPV